MNAASEGLQMVVHRNVSRHCFTSSLEYRSNVWVSRPGKSDINACAFLPLVPIPSRTIFLSYFLLTLTHILRFNSCQRKDLTTVLAVKCWWRAFPYFLFSQTLDSLVSFRPLSLSGSWSIYISLLRCVLRAKQLSAIMDWCTSQLAKGASVSAGAVAGEAVDPVFAIPSILAGTRQTLVHVDLAQFSYREQE